MNTYQRNRVIRLWRQGYKPWLIARDMGLAVSDVNSLLYRHHNGQPTDGLTPRERKEKREQSRRNIDRRKLLKKWVLQQSALGVPAKDIIKYFPEAAEWLNQSDQ